VRRPGTPAGGRSLATPRPADVAVPSRRGRPVARGSTRAGEGRRPPSARPGRRLVSRSGATRAPSPTPPTRAKLTGRAAVLLLVLAVLGVSYASSARAWLQQRSDINSLTAQIATTKARIATLEQEKQRWHDPAYIRTQARERFGWLMPGEIGYRVIDRHGRIVPSGSSLSKPRAATPPSDAQWWQRAWDSIVAAGAEPVAQPHRRSLPAPLRSIGKVAHFRPPHQVRPDDWLLPHTARGTAGH
jgi:cell division protein FtsB